MGYNGVNGGDAEEFIGATKVLFLADS